MRRRVTSLTLQANRTALHISHKKSPWSKLLRCTRHIMEVTVQPVVCRAMRVSMSFYAFRRAMLVDRTGSQGAERAIRRAFTLTELMVVIAIIGILVSII